MTHVHASPIQHLVIRRRHGSPVAHLATRLLARSLNMPEPVVHTTGMFVFARVTAIENRVGRTLSPIRLLRRLQSRLRQTTH